MSDATRATILFVDDSPTMRGMIRAALTQGGYDIVVKNLGSAPISHRQLAKAVGRAWPDAAGRARPAGCAVKDLGSVKGIGYRYG